MSWFCGLLQEVYSRICRPLTEERRQPDVRFCWGTDQQQSFELLKKTMTTKPVLGYPDYSLPFEVHTDACYQGLGAVLYQA
jgi:hypothetical protein